MHQLEIAVAKIPSSNETYDSTVETLERMYNDRYFNYVMWQQKQCTNRSTNDSKTAKAKIQRLITVGANDSTDEVLYRVD